MTTAYPTKLLQHPIATVYRIGANSTVCVGAEASVVPQHPALCLGHSDSARAALLRSPALLRWPILCQGGSHCTAFWGTMQPFTPACGDAGASRGRSLPTATLRGCAAEFAGRLVVFVVDRPLGTRHRNDSALVIVDLVGDSLIPGGRQVAVGVLDDLDRPAELVERIAHNLRRRAATVVVLCQIVKEPFFNQPPAAAGCIGLLRVRR